MLLFHLGILPDYNCMFSDFYHALACLFLTGYFNAYEWDNENPEMNHFIPNIVKFNKDQTIDTSNTSRLMTKIVKDLIPSSDNNSIYKNVGVKEIPIDATATAFRSGGITELDAAGIAPHAIALLTGHDMTKVCATYEYLWITWASTAKAVRILT